MACIMSTFFLESLALGFLLVTSGITLVQGGCTFPSAVRGVWVRGQDSKSLTFTDSEVSGLAIGYSGSTLDTFSCRMSSGNQYVINSEEYSGSFGQTLFYICWEFVRVTDSAYLLYELSNEAGVSYGSDRGHAAAASNDASLQMSDVCHQSTSTQLFTTLVKNGASASDVASSCPSSLIATFSYGKCADTELDFCSDEKTAVLNYTKCATQVFNSAGGTLSCMGDATNASYTYLNLFNHDGGGGVTCFRYMNNGDGTISGDYYTGDCTTSVSDSLTLTKIASCPTPPPPTQASTSDGNAVSAKDDSSEDKGPIIAGAVVGSLAFIAAAAVITVVLLRKAKSSKVSASTSEIETPEPEKADSELPDKPANGTANGAANGAVVNGSAPELIVETPEANS